MKYSYKWSVGSNFMTKFDELVSVINTEFVYIQTHNFPDPDAISSAFALQQLLKTKNICAKICYKGKVDRTNIKLMKELFGIEIFDVDTLEEISEEDKIILIDSQKGNGNITQIRGSVIASIDHHPMNVNVDYEFSDIREDIGACVSIVASYYLENNIEMSDDVAEAILYGINVDTANMTRGVSKLDLDIFYKLFNRTKRKKISRLENETMQVDDLKAFAKAIESISISNIVGIANTGDDCPEALIGTIADFILKIETVKIAFVYSVKSTGIKISVRCMKDSHVDAGALIVDALKGIGTGGGHPTMAGGFVPYVGLDECEIQELLVDVKRRFMNSVEKFTG